MSMMETESPEVGTQDGLDESTLPEGSDAGEQHEDPVLFELDGEQITLSEARNGYLRQRDYTKKTQSVAERARELDSASALVAALGQDPHRTLAALVDAYGVQLQPQSAPAQRGNADPYFGVPDESQPDPRVSQLEQRLAVQERAANVAAAEKQLAQLHAEYGENAFDDAEVVNYAVRHNIGDLRVATQSVLFERKREQEAQVANRRAREQAVVDQKRTAGNLVEGGTTRTTGAVTGDAPPKGSTFRQIAEWTLAHMKD